MSTTLIENGIIITLGDNNKVLYGHSLLIEGDKIKKIAPAAEFKDKYDTVIDARGKVVMPGFINAHMHFYSTLVCGLGKADPSKDFNEVLKNLWWRLDKKLVLDDCYYSALLPMINAIKRGTTTLIDHHASPFAITGSLDVIAKAVKETGLRASLCYELSDRDGEKIAQEGIEENVNFIKRCNKEKDPQLSALFGLHASFTINDKTMEKAVKAAEGLGCGYHVHTAEAISDQDYNVKHFGTRVVQRFKKFGILGPKTICAHCVHINDDEMDILKETDTVVVHNPQSNMNNAVGVADIISMSKKGILVGLGTDAMTVNMLEEMRSAMWIRHLAEKDPSCGFMEVTTLLPFNNPKIANRHFSGLGLGELKAGNAADVICVDYIPFTPFDESNFLGHLCFGIGGASVDTTIAGGKILMHNKTLKINIDEQKIAHEAQSLAKSLWERF